jgi:hypothetical protein
MNPDTGPQTVENDELKEWFQQHVASEIEEAKQSEIAAEHAQGWQKGVLAWFAEHYVPDDPTSLILPDGSGDGGMDIVSIVTSEARNHVRIFQCSAPRPEAIAEGRLSTGKTKFADDVRELRNNIVGKARRLKELNPTAQDVIRQINAMREVAIADENPTPLTIEVQPLTLRLAHPDSRRELEELGMAAKEEWSSAGEEWIVRDVLDARALYLRWRRSRPKDASPPELKLHLFGDVTKDHAERGPFLCFVRAGDLIRAYEEWGAGLLDANLRYALGKSEVNKTIETELERVSGVKWFHEKNNGLVIVCHQCLVGRDSVKLSSPQIVNGGQTLHSVWSVAREIESMALELRSSDDKTRLKAIYDDLRLSVRIVTVSGGNIHKADQISIASNTQNKLSERTMRSASVEMRNLRLQLAGMECPWYLITKDGEWAAVARRKSLFQSRTGNRQIAEFKDGTRYRRFENADAAVAMMAFLGFLEDARPSRVFRPNVFSLLFGSRPTREGWKTIAARQIEWKGSDFDLAFESGMSSGRTWLIAHFLWSFWKTFTFPESQQFLLALEEAGQKDVQFKRAHHKTSGWDMSDEARAELLKSPDSCYWKEQVAKSAYLALVYQSMRVLVKCVGSLDDETCKQVLNMRQFKDLATGQPVSSLQDFRQGSLSDGPLTALGRILLYACELFWERHEPRIRLMASRQQTLLQKEWVDRLSNQVDLILERVAQPSYRHAMEGPKDGELSLKTVDDLFN